MAAAKLDPLPSAGHQRARLRGREHEDRRPGGCEEVELASVDGASTVHDGERAIPLAVQDLEPPAGRVRSRPERRVGRQRTALDLYVAYVALVWGGLGGFVAPFVAFGIAQRRRWAYLLGLAYAIASLPTVVGTAVALMGLHILSRTEVRAAFGRVTRVPRSGAPCAPD